MASPGIDESDDSLSKLKPVRSGPERVIRRRMRLKPDQVAVLEAEFQRDSSWRKEQTYALADRLKMKRLKVYKWGYERKKKVDTGEAI